MENSDNNGDSYRENGAPDAQASRQEEKNIPKTNAGAGKALHFTNHTNPYQRSVRRTNSIYQKELNTMDYTTDFEVPNPDDGVFNTVNRSNYANSLQEDKASAVPVSEEGSEGIRPVCNATAVVTVSPDKMMARMSLLAPENGGRDLTEAELLSEVTAMGITAGIKKEVINRLAVRPVYRLPFKVAEGKKVHNGANGKLEPCFDVTGAVVFPEDESGDVDYRELNLIKNVVQNELVANVIPPEKGVNGYTIFGDEILAKDGKAIVSPVGTNTYLTEDGTNLLAAIDGYVTLKKDKIIVENILKLRDVDATTGNITFNGSIVIAGDIRDGFTVNATQDIVVSGVVEDAVLIAGGNIVLKSGVNGKKSKISAEGDLKVDFIENTFVDVKGEVIANTIINGHIICGENIVMQGRRGCIMSGTCWAKKGITAKQIGNRNHIVTKVIVAGPSTYKKECLTCEMKLEELEESFVKLKNLKKAVKSSEQFEDAEREAILVRTEQSLESTSQKIEEQRTEVARLHKLIKETLAGQIVVTDHLHTNVVVEIDGILYRNTAPRDRCIIKKSDDRIVIVSNGVGQEEA